jgi:NADH-quinone oxidoreductase subunit J
MDLQPYLGAFLFWVIGGVTAACAVATVVTHNIVRAATWLLFTLGGTSALFFLIGADLVGAVQLLVYVGGTMVLVVFGVMLTAQGPFISMRTSSAEWAISAATGIGLLALLFFAIMANKATDHGLPETEPVVAFAPKSPLSDPNESDNAKTSHYTMVIGQGFAGVGVGPAHKDPQNRKLAMTERQATPLSKEDAAKKKPTEEPTGAIRTNYLLPFEIVSVHLLVVLIAAAYLARSKRVEARS